jgi:hypothetical protein
MCLRHPPPLTPRVARSSGSNPRSMMTAPAPRRWPTLTRASHSIPSRRRHPWGTSTSMLVLPARVFSISPWMRIMHPIPFPTHPLSSSPRPTLLLVVASLRQPPLPGAARGTFGLVLSSRTPLVLMSCLFRPSRPRLPCSELGHFPGALF